MTGDRKLRIRGKDYRMLHGIRMPSLYFYPDTPKKVVWLEN